MTDRCVIAPFTVAGVDATLQTQLRQRVSVGVESGVLIEDKTVPVQSEGLQRAQDVIGRTRHFAGPIDVLDPHEPLGTVMTRIQITAHRGEQGTQMQSPRR